MNLLFIFLFLSLSLDDISTKTDQFIEIGSSKIFKIDVEMNDPIYSITIKSGLMEYREILSRKGDTLFIENRLFRFGILKTAMKYTPLRPRIVFPIIESDSLNYEGIETIFNINYKVKTKLIIEHLGNSYDITSISYRNNKEDVSTMLIDSSGMITYISLKIPAFPIIYRLLGFKKQLLEFIPYDERY